MLTRRRAAAAPGLLGLPHDLLCQVVRRVSQTDRVACMTTCHALLAAAISPGVWTTVCFTDLDSSAVRFMDVHRCPTVHVTTACPDDVAWFFEMLAKLHIDCVERLCLWLEPTLRLPSDFLRGIGALTRLRHLRLEIASLEDPSEVYFGSDHGLASLRSLEIVERTEGSKQLVVWWEASHARFERLQTAVLDVGLSDVMTGLRHLPRLRRLAYNFEPVEGGETYEDAELQGADLDVLEITVDCETDFATLGEQLGLVARVGSLVLNCEDEYVDLTDFDWSRVDSLALRMHATRTEVKLDFEGLRRSRLAAVDVSVGAPWADNQELVSACRHTLFFTRVSAPREWAEHVAAGRLDLRLLPTTCVHLAV